MSDHDILDRAVAVREGETLDVSALERYLRARLPGFESPLTVSQFPSGYSNLTYMLASGDRELVLRRPPFGAKIKTAHDMSREYRVLSHLTEAYPLVPEPFVYCEDASVIGAPFYVMRRVRGVILRNKPPRGMSLTQDLMRNLSRSFVDNLARLHAVDYASVGLGDLGKPEGYVQRQVSGWTKRYRNAKTDALPEVEAAGAWLLANQPESSAESALIHNDFKYDNLVLDPEDPAKVLAVLDWEMATIGDPLMDLGTSLAYWAEAGDPVALKTFGLTSLPGNFDRREVVARYVDASGRQIADPVFYFVYGLFKLAVIGQQIYARFKKGYSKDPRFGALIHVVRTCGVMAARAIDLGRIHDLGLEQ